MTSRSVCNGAQPGIDLDLSFRNIRTRENDYGQDRNAMKLGDFTGIKGIPNQDIAMWETMGPIADRSKENLVSTDNGIIMARHRLRKAAEALKKGIAPPGIDPATHRVRSASVVLPPDVAFKDAAKEALIATEGTPFTSV